MIAGAVAASVPRAAEACEPGGDWVHQVWPADGAILPANGVLVATGPTLDPASFQVRVDDVLVDVEVVDRFTAPDDDSNKRVVGVRPVTPPPIGSTLSLRRCPVGSTCDDLGAWVVGEADDTAPTPASTVSFDVLELPGCRGSSCGGWYDYFVYAHVDTDEPPDEPRIAVLRVRRAGAPFDEIHVTAFDESTHTEAFILSDAMFDGDPVDTSLCLEVRLFDQAGNEAQPSLGSCLPCHYVVAESVFACEGLEPDWTEDDLAEESECIGVALDPLPPLDPEPPSGSTGTGGDTGDGSGADSASSGGTDGGADEGAGSTDDGADRASAAGDDGPPAPTPLDDGGDEDTDGIPPAADGDGGIGVVDRGCSCRSTAPGAPLWLVLVGFGAVRVRRTRGSTSP